MLRLNQLETAADMRQLALGGDGLETNQALNRFLAGVERRALRMAAISTGNPEDALDIVQDAMMKLATRYPDRPEDQWGALFQRILQNGITDWHRRSWVRERWRKFIGSKDVDCETDDPLQHLPDNRITDPGEKLQHEHALAGLEQAIRQLSLRQQQAFMLRLWEGLSVEETAHAMGCSRGSVKTHYSRALASLRQSLEDHWP
jgi:RNA polymerase sigma-70 factor (ECF subfamily)